MNNLEILALQYFRQKFKALWFWLQMQAAMFFDKVGK